MKTCKKCGGTDFYASGGCRPCGKERAKEYRKNHPEKARSAIKAWSERNKDKVNASSIKWQKNNKDKIKVIRDRYAEKNKEKLKQRFKNWYEKNREYALAKHRQWTEDNKDHIRAYSLSYKEKNPDKLRECWNKRRERIKNQKTKLSVGLIDRLKTLQKNKCAICKKHLGDNYHLDHIVPIKLGGEHHDSNMQLLHSSCNMKKHAKHPVDHMQSLGFLL